MKNIFKVFLLCLVIVLFNTNVFSSELSNYVKHFDEIYERKLLEGAEKQFVVMCLYNDSFKSNLIKKYPKAYTSQTECIKLINDYLSRNNSYRQYINSSDVQIYCSPDNLYQILEIGYHDIDDKSAFWIPNGVNPLMMTNGELEAYRIIDVKTNTKYNFNDPFVKKKIMFVNMQKRPLIKKDMYELEDDFKSREDLTDVLKNAGLARRENYSTRQYETVFVPLSNTQEQELNRLINIYGIDSFDEDFRRNLNLYREREQYMKKNNKINVPETTKNILNEVLRFL